MTPLRVIGGLASLIIAGLLLIEVCATVPVLWEGLSHVGEETTFYQARRVLGVQLSGWQLFAYAFAGGAAALAFGAMGFYALSPRKGL